MILPLFRKLFSLFSQVKRKSEQSKGTVITGSIIGKTGGTAMLPDQGGQAVNEFHWILFHLRGDRFFQQKDLVGLFQMLFPDFRPLQMPEQAGFADARFADQGDRLGPACPDAGEYPADFHGTAPEIIC